MTHLFHLFYECSGISTDTRNILPNNLFIALKGENFNGNAFAEQAIRLGARYAIVDENEYQTNDKIFLVENTLQFLQDLANYHRKQFDIPVIGITGSNGKTSTKELINTVLSTTYKVLCTQGNLNNHIGVPLTLLQLTSAHDIAIIEMGANKLKDIQELCLIAEPSYGIITNIGRAHLEGFGSFEGVLQTKRELYQSISAIEGTIVINNDDAVLTENAPKNVTRITYGTTQANVKGYVTKVDPFISFKYIHEDYQSPEIKSHLVGKYNLYNFLGAVSFGILFKVPYKSIEEALSMYTPENNRSQVAITASNRLILDCYNANPTSMSSALESFALMSDKNKYFILGDMLELGNESDKEHLMIALLCETLGLQGITIGPCFKKTHTEAFRHQFLTLEDAIQYLSEHPITGNTILLKGSRGIGLERLQPYL